MLRITSSRVHFHPAWGLPRCVMCSCGLCGCGFVMQVTRTSATACFPSGACPFSDGLGSLYQNPLFWVVLREKKDLSKQFCCPSVPGFGQNALLQQADSGCVLGCLERRGYQSNELLALLGTKNQVGVGNLPILSETLNRFEECADGHENRSARVSCLPFHPIFLGSSDHVVAMALVGVAFLMPWKQQR